MNNDYGHWAVFEEVDIKNYLGFVYVITFENGSKYVGAKKIWKRIKTPPCSFKRGPKKGFEESDWKTYTSSSNEVNSMISQGIHPKEYLIVGWYSSWGKTLMAEMEMQLANDVLRDPTWLNRQIGGHFNPNCFDDLTDDDIKRWLSFDKGNEHVQWPVMYKLGQKTKYVNPKEIQKYLDSGWDFGRSKTEQISSKRYVSSFNLYDYENNCVVKVEGLMKFARDNDISGNHITRLLQGDLDLIKDRWGLPPDISRQRYKVKNTITGKMYLSISEVDKELGSRGASAKLLKSGELVKLTVESKEAHKEKLSKLDLVSRTVIEDTRIIQENSYKSLVESWCSTGKSKADLLNWAEKYVEYLKSQNSFQDSAKMI